MSYLEVCELKIITISWGFPSYAKKVCHIKVISCVYMLKTSTKGLHFDCEKSDAVPLPAVKGILVGVTHHVFISFD